MSATERLSTLDEFGGRKRVIPAEVTGRLRTWRTRVHAVLLLTLMVLPWIKINGLQAVLLDIPARRFELFGVLFMSHDAPLLFFVFMLIVLLLALVTALWGRVWCGWACPQTVFIDSVYRRIEIWTEGNYIQRRKLHAQSLNFEKFWRVSLKWMLYLVVSSVIAHSVIAYFSGSSRLLSMMQVPPSENWTYFLLVTGVTGFLLFNFGWFREQFCIIMCPYGRFQSVLMDSNTVAVMYDEKRGEPRKDKTVSAEKRGDCVSCNRCVEVCPTGIDIRQGIQMECISCTACIDACNATMRKVNKPEGLIRHQKIAGTSWSPFRPRIIAYSALALILSLALTYILIAREPYAMTFHRAKDAPFQTMQDGSILNHFKAHFMNQSLSGQEFQILLPETENQRGIKLTQMKASHVLREGESTEAHFFLNFPPSLLHKGELKLNILVREQVGGKSETIELTGVGPYSSGS